MIAFDSESEMLKHYRVDKMTDISILDEKRKGTMTFMNQDKAVYSQKRFRMFNGDVRTVKLKCKNYLSNVIVDQFGRNIKMNPIDDEWFTVDVEVAVSNQFYGWVVALGGDAVIVTPTEVKAQIEDLLTKSYTE